MSTMGRVSRTAISLTLISAAVAGGLAVWLMLVALPRVQQARQEPAGLYIGGLLLVSLALWLLNEISLALRTRLFETHVQQGAEKAGINLPWGDVEHVQVRGYRVVLRGAQGRVVVPCWLFENSTSLFNAVIKAAIDRRHLTV